MKTPQFLIKQTCLPSINITNKKNELCIDLTNCQAIKVSKNRHNCNSFRSFQVFPSVPLLCYAFFSFFKRLFSCFTQFSDSSQRSNFEKFRDTVPLNYLCLSCTKMEFESSTTENQHCYWWKWIVGMSSDSFPDSEDHVV